MRIAVSGTHCCGKSTLIDQFLLTHPEFAHEPEPYYVLQEEYGEIFAAEPSADDFIRQLEYNLSRLCAYQPGARVIFERSPVDFLAYLLALDDLGREDVPSSRLDRSRDRVREAIGFLDLIVFLPITDRDRIAMPEAEDYPLRDAVNSYLERLLIDDDDDFFAPGRPVVLEATGSTAERLRRLEKALG